MNLSVDSSENGRGVTPPVGWLEDYWMGRYYGFIEPPSTNHVSMPSIPVGTAARRVAEPYTGSARPSAR